MGNVKVRVQYFEYGRPAFKEYCEINGLKNGDFYDIFDFIRWANGLRFSEIVKITQKWSNEK